MIFYGNKYTGKLTAALELARILNCEQESQPECQCFNCLLARDYESPNILILGTPDFSRELETALYLYEQNNSLPVIIWIRQIIRKIFLCINLSILDHYKLSEKNKNDIQALFTKIHAILDKDKFNKKDLSLLNSISTEQSLFLKTENIPISATRYAVNWSHIRDGNNKKIIIILNADKMLESSRNSILKRLEDYSDHLYFILICQSLNNIIPTILSRCRKYKFNELKFTDVQKIIKNKIQSARELNHNQMNTDEYGSLYDFFTQVYDFNKSTINKKANTILSLLISTNSEPAELINEIEKLDKKEEIIEILIEIHNQILSIMKSVYNEDPDNTLAKKILTEFNPLELQSYLKLIEERINQIKIFNTNPNLVIQSLLLPLHKNISRSLI